MKKEKHGHGESLRQRRRRKFEPDGPEVEDMGWR